MVGSVATLSFSIPFPSFPDFLLTSGIPSLAVPFRCWWLHRRRQQGGVVVFIAGRHPLQAASSSSSQAGLPSKRRHCLRRRRAFPPGKPPLQAAPLSSSQAGLPSRQAIVFVASHRLHVPFPIPYHLSALLFPICQALGISARSACLIYSPRRRSSATRLAVNLLCLCQSPPLPALSLFRSFG
ncbi:hypothetical protein ACLOJK_009508 [Asimina triloba]